MGAVSSQLSTGMAKKNGILKLSSRTKRRRHRTAVVDKKKKTDGLEKASQVYDWVQYCNWRRNIVLRSISFVARGGTQGTDQGGGREHSIKFTLRLPVDSVTTWTKCHKQQLVDNIGKCDSVGVVGLCQSHCSTAHCPEEEKRRVGSRVH